MNNFLPMFRIYKMLNIILNRINDLEKCLMSLRDDLTANEAAVTQAITDLANRIAQLPVDADAITQADVDDLKNFASTLGQLAPSTSANTPTPGGDTPVDGSGDGSTPSQ